MDLLIRATETGITCLQVPGDNVYGQCNLEKTPRKLWQDMMAIV